jgi:hypothetical protein
MSYLFDTVEPGARLAAVGGGEMTAASLTLFSLLAGPRRPARVLGIVPGAVYLEIDEGEQPDVPDGPERYRPGSVVALLEPEAVQLPIGLVLPPAASGLVPISVGGAPVSRGPIFFGHGAISLAGARWPVLKWWNPGVPPLDLPTAVSPFGPELLGAAAELPAEGLAAIATGDSARAVDLLIGTGPGLTPAGDEALCGALAALAAWAPDSPARRDLATAVSAATARTTAISAALLRSAVAGCAVPPLIRLLTALSAGDLVGIHAAGQELTAGGASCGPALAVGAIHQLRQLLTSTTRKAL